MYDLKIRNATIPFGKGNETKIVDILVNKGKTVGIGSFAEIDAASTLDLNKKLLIPGAIDAHVHFCDPGMTHREDFLCGTKGAAVGGLTTVLEHPLGTVPDTRSAGELIIKYEAVKDSAVIDYGLWGGITGLDMEDHKFQRAIAEMAQLGVVAFKVFMVASIPTFTRVSSGDMRLIMEEVAKTGIPLGVHAEDYNIVETMSNRLMEEKRFDPLAWIEGRTYEAEPIAIFTCLKISEATHCPLHIVHLSTAEGARLIQEGKSAGIDVTAETCPQYLTLTQDAIKKWGSIAKVAPPLRHQRDIDVLWNSLQDGTLDLMGTDHAPYEAETEKNQWQENIWLDCPGFPGTELMLPVMISEGLNKGKISLQRLVELVGENPAKRFGLYPRKGVLAPGADADYTVIDLDEEWTIDAKELQTKAKYSPLHGMKLKGKPVTTIVRGKIVYDSGQGFLVKPGYGQWIKRE